MFSLLEVTPLKSNIDAKNHGFQNCTTFQIWHHFLGNQLSFSGVQPVFFGGRPIL